MDVFKELTDETDNQVLKFGKAGNIKLLLGYTGSGKSTAIQYLAGSKLEKTYVNTKKGGKLDHIDVMQDGYPYNCDPELKHVSLSPFNVSETRFLRAIKIPIPSKTKKNNDLTLCDTPGLKDTRGKELDVANQYGLVKIAQNCLGVLPILVISEMTVGDRG